MANRIRQNVIIVDSATGYKDMLSPGFNKYLVNTISLDLQNSAANMTVEGSNSGIAVDVSASAHALTFTGDAKLSSTQKKFGSSSLYLDGTGDYVTAADDTDFDFSNGEGSCYFDGTGDYITTADHADFNFGANDFTIEFFVNFSDITGTRTIVSQWQSAANNRAFLFGWAPNAFYFYYTTDGTGGTLGSKSFSYTPTTGVWYHVALSRDGNNLRCFVNGTQAGATADMTGVTIFDSTYDFQAGIQESLDNPFLGYVDELRVSDNARYTTAFTAPTEAFTTDANTKYLLHFSGMPGDTITDSSGTGKTTNKGGNADISKITYKFIAGWTIDFWGYLDLTNNATFFYHDTTDYNTDSIACTVLTNGSLSFVIRNNSNILVNCTSATGAVTASTWTHIELCQSGDSYKWFVNGTDVTANGGTSVFRPANYTGAPQIGKWGTQVTGLIGYIDEYRITNGTCRHTANFNPSQFPYTTDSYTKLLLHFDIGDCLYVLNENQPSINFAVPQQFTTLKVPVLSDGTGFIYLA